jgi:hypothetical protein
MKWLALWMAASLAAPALARAIYRYIRDLGPAGKRPAQPFVRFPAAPPK